MIAVVVLVELEFIFLAGSLRLQTTRSGQSYSSGQILNQSFSIPQSEKNELSVMKQLQVQ